MTTGNKTHQYQEEFGANFDLGFDLEAYPHLTDVSFCQDACPQFYFSHDDKYFLVMVEHKDVREREDESSPRYLILNAYNSMTRSNPCICLDEDNNEPVLATEDTATFVEYIDSKREKGLFIVTVRLREYDSKYGFEKGDITKTYVPVIASDEDSAQQKAVVWQSDNGTASRNNEQQWSCAEPERALSWTAIRCLSVSQDEFDIFLCTTEGLRDARICGGKP